LQKSYTQEKKLISTKVLTTDSAPTADYAIRAEYMVHMLHCTVLKSQIIQNVHVEGVNCKRPSCSIFTLLSLPLVHQLHSNYQ